MRSILVCCATSLLVTGCNSVNIDVVDMGSPGGDLSPIPVRPHDLGGPATALVAGAELQSVSGDQSLLAYLTGVTSSNGVNVGRLTVTSLPLSPTKVIVSDDAWAAGFSGPSSLLYLAGPTPSSDANSTAVYGALGMWRPGQSAGIHLSTGLALMRVAPPSSAWTMYWDVPTPSVMAAGAIKLARLADCTATACVPVTVAASVSRVATMNVSPDGRFAAYVVNLGATPATYDVYLVTEATGASVRVSASAMGLSNSFSPDGNRFAALGPGGALVVIDTSTGQPATWAAMPAGAKTLQVAFADSMTLLVCAIPAGARTGNVFVTSAASVTTLATGVAAMEVPLNTFSTTASARYAFMFATLSGGVGPVVGYDLSAATPKPIPIATAASPTSIWISYDQVYLRVLDNFDNTRQNGTLVAVSLPDGTATTLAQGVSNSTPTFQGQHMIFYLDGNGALGSWLDGTVTTYAGGVDQFRVRGAGPSSIYFSVDVAAAPYDYQPGLYVTAP
jgi:hypothetical protein